MPVEASRFTQADFSQQLDIPPSVPAIVARVWQAVDAFYADPRHLEPPTYAQLSELLFRADPDKAGSEASIYRAHRTHPNLLPWPIHRGMRPAWEPLGYEEAVAEAGFELIARDLQTGQEQRVEVRVDQAGRLCLIKSLAQTGTALAASLGTLAVLDSMDGRVDGVVHWCLAIAKLMHQAL